MRTIPGTWDVRHKLHPQTGFFAIFSFAVIIALLILTLVRAGPNEASMLGGLAGTFGLCATATGGRLVSDLGHSVSWDREAVYVREQGVALRLRWFPWAKLPLDQISGIQLLGPPRGVPPKFPLIEIVGPWQGRRSHLIDPNFFDSSSLAEFFDDIRTYAPALCDEDNGPTLDRLLEILSR